MWSKVGLPIVAAALLGFAIMHVTRANQPPPKVAPPIEPARSPYRATIAGAGIVEPQTENVHIGSALSGLVVEVAVRVGQKVAPGELLFKLDDRQYQAELRFRQASLRAAEAQLAKLDAMPRDLEMPPAEARVAEAEAIVADARDQFQRAQKLVTTRAIGEEEFVRKQQALRVAEQQLARARADLALIKDGAWEFDKEVARAAVAQAKAQLAQVQTELDRLEVRVPQPQSPWLAGKGDEPFEVLQVNIRPGEYVAASSGQALVVLGCTGSLHVRVDIDENDLPRFRPGLKGVCQVRGDAKVQFPLQFVRVEPYVVPKRSLSGATTERVDTRVLPVIYRVETGSQRLYVGQQVDVFLQADEAP